MCKEKLRLDLADLLGLEFGFLNTLVSAVESSYPTHVGAVCLRIICILQRNNNAELFIMQTVATKISKLNPESLNDFQNLFRENSHEILTLGAFLRSQLTEFLGLVVSRCCSSTFDSFEHFLGFVPCSVRHVLGFLRLKIQEKLSEFDSCAVIANFFSLRVIAPAMSMPIQHGIFVDKKYFNSLLHFAKKVVKNDSLFVFIEQITKSLFHDVKCVDFPNFKIQKTVYFSSNSFSVISKNIQPDDEFIDLLFNLGNNLPEILRPIVKKLHVSAFRRFTRIFE